MIDFRNIPPNALPSIAKSAVCSFVGSFIKTYGYFTLYNRDPSQKFNIAGPLMNAGLAALSSLIYSLTTPIFTAIFESPETYPHRELMKEFINVIIGSVLISYFTASKVNLSALMIFSRSYSLNTIKSVLDIFPSVVGWWKPALEQEIRQGYAWLGIQVINGSGSVFINI